MTLLTVSFPFPNDMTPSPVPVTSTLAPFAAVISSDTFFLVFYQIIVRRHMFFTRNSNVICLQSHLWMVWILQSNWIIKLLLTIHHTPQNQSRAVYLLPMHSLGLLDSRLPNNAIFRYNPLFSYNFWIQFQTPRAVSHFWICMSQFWI